MEFECRTGIAAHMHRHVSKAAALSLALHMAQCAMRGSAQPGAQGSSAPSIAQMGRSRGSPSHAHVLLVSREQRDEVNLQTCTHAGSVKQQMLPIMAAFNFFLLHALLE